MISHAAARSLALLALVACDLTLGSQRPRGLVEISGVMESCRISGGQVSFAIRADLSLKSFTIAVDSISWPSAAYQKTIGATYWADGDCPVSGKTVSVMTCEGCPPALVAAEAIDEMGEHKRRLWLVQQFEDRLRSNDDTHWHLLGMSSVLAKHTQLDGRERSFWLRDKISRALDTYSSPQRAATMIARFGRPEYSQSIAQLREIYDKHSDEVGLVKAVPFSTAGFIGGWGHFVTEVYIEKGHGELSKIF